MQSVADVFVEVSWDPLSHNLDVHVQVHALGSQSDVEAFIRSLLDVVHGEGRKKYVAGRTHHRCEVRNARTELPL